MYFEIRYFTKSKKKRLVYYKIYCKIFMLLVKVPATTY